MTNISNSDDVIQLKTQLSTARSEINNLRQQLKTLNHTYRKDCDEIRRQLENWRCDYCKHRQLEAAATPAPVVNYDLGLQYIGTIHTHFPEKRGTPRQPGICSDTTAKLTLNEVFTNPSHALDGLQEYSHMWILFHFHKNDATHTRAKVSPPRLNGIRTGVFATRSPHRPCPIGLSLVKIDHITDNNIYFSGVDMIDQTPVLDIKPYIPQYDNPSDPFQSEIDISTLSLTESQHETDSVRLMDGQENGERDQPLIGGTSSNPIVNRNLEDSYHESRSASRIGEREAPDGEEEETPHQYASASVSSPQQVRVPTWIDQPPISTLTVYFKRRALVQLQQLGNEGEQKKNIIKNILQEDPRSVYLRERVGNSDYVFRIAELYVSCKFDDTSHVVTVFQVFQDLGAQAEN
uniref:TsaA-like domain-containing protein n=1 Tax=Photinus pyralis TaxID=7054 RepID=A0A1Y1NLL2_PHOPY